MDIKQDRFRKTSAPENMISLVNIIFLLLIFFMLAGSLSAPKALDVNPPESKGILAAETDGVYVLYTKDGLTALNEVILDRRKLLDALEIKLVQEPKLKLSLEADAQLKAEELVGFLRELKEVGVDNLILKTSLRL